MDVQAGSDIPTWSVALVDTEKMKTMAALLRDPNPIHWDVQSVRALGMGDRVVNQGPSNMAYIVNMLVDWIGDARLVRGLSVRFLANVFGGDAVVAGGRVSAVRDEDGTRIAECDVWLDREGGERVLSGTATVELPDGA